MIEFEFEFDDFKAGKHTTNGSSGCVESTAN